MKQDPVSDLVTGTGRVTVRAIAAETGLSIATVSRVLNGGGNVATATRERVRHVVEQLGSRAPEPRRRPAAVRATRRPVFVRCPYLLTDYFGHIVTSTGPAPESLSVLDGVVAPRANSRTLFAPPLATQRLCLESTKRPPG